MVLKVNITPVDQPKTFGNMLTLVDRQLSS